MAAKPHQQGKVRVVIECSLDERAYIKMLAARKHMTISEYFLSMEKRSEQKLFISQLPQIMQEVYSIILSKILKFF